MYGKNMDPFDLQNLNTEKIVHDAMVFL
jgi:hypothetical protein